MVITFNVAYVGCSLRKCIAVRKDAAMSRMARPYILALTLILLTWTIWRAPTNASKWRTGFNSAFKGLRRLDFWG